MFRELTFASYKDIRRATDDEPSAPRRDRASPPPARLSACVPIVTFYARDPLTTLTYLLLKLGVSDSQPPGQTSGADVLIFGLLSDQCILF